MRRENRVVRDLVMKRAIAFIINYIIFCIIIIGVSICGLIFTSKIWLEDMNKIFEIGLYITAFGIFLLWIYFFLQDYYEKLDCGKRILKIEILFCNCKPTFNIILKHSILKTLSCLIWPLSFCFYLINGRMPYDKFLKISVREKIIE